MKLRYVLGRSRRSPREALSERVLACNANARALVRSAVRVAKGKAYGTALSLMILAYEEAMKGFIYHAVDQGWATFDLEHKGKPSFVEESLLENHPLKQYLIFAFDLSVHGFARGVKDEVAAGRDPGVHRRILGGVVQEAGLGPMYTWTFNDLKNRGLYVQIAPSGVHTPAETPREHFDSLGSRIALRVLLVEALERMRLTSAYKEEIRKLALTSGPIYDEEFVKSLQKLRRSMGTERFVKEMVHRHKWLMEPLRPRD